MKILLISTGGTIAMAAAASGDGVRLTLDSDYFSRALRSPKIRVASYSFSQAPSIEFDSTYASGLAAFISDNLSDYDAFIVTHGTDTMEETAFFLELVLDTDRPVILTGAMTPAEKPGYDGLSNLIDSVKVASDPASRGKGVLVVFDKDVISGMYARKTESLRSGAFESAHGGKLGSVTGPKVTYHYDVRPHRRLENHASGAVALIKVHYDVGATLLRNAYDSHRAVVLEAAGSGRVPSRLLPLIEEYSDRLTVISTRAHHGYLYDEYAFDGSYRDLSTRKVVFSPFDSLKSCILAGLCLGNGLDYDETRTVFEEFWP